MVFTDLSYYHYWFNGKRLLNSPLDTMLKSGKPEIPFCYIWANENWTRHWDGADNEIIIKQNILLKMILNIYNFYAKMSFAIKDI